MTYHKDKIPIFFLLTALFLFLALVILKTSLSKAAGDQESFAIAETLLKEGVFANAGEVTPGYNRPPGYPIFLAAIGWLTFSSYGDFNCNDLKDSNCPKDALSKYVQFVQLLLTAVTIILSFFIARELSCSNQIAALTLILFLFNGRLINYSYLTEPFAITTMLLLVCLYFLILSYNKQSHIYVALAGLFIGLTSLLYPPLGLTPLFIAPILLLTKRDNLAEGLTYSLLFLFAAGLTVAPWLCRNYIYFGDFSLAHSYTNISLAGRVAYNGLSVTEWAASLLYWQPWLGKNIAELLFNDEVIGRLSSAAHEKSILTNEALQILKNTYDASNPTGHFMTIVKTHILNDLLRYLATTSPLFFKSFWGTGNFMSIISIFFIWSLLKRLKYANKLSVHLLLLSCLIGSSIAQALLTPSFGFFNNHMIFLHSYTIAYVVGELELMPIIRKFVKI